jgi:hypothetical protein
MNDQAAGANAGAKSADEAHFNLVVDKATDKFDKWQQIPAWVLGAAAIVGAACLIAFAPHLSDAQSRDAWAAVIVALFLAVLLSYRSAFTLNANGGGAADAGGGGGGGGGGEQGGQPGQPGGQPGQQGADKP